MTKQCFEDCQVGERAVSEGRTITEADIVAYAALTGDWNPIHCNAQFMSEHAFGERIAHGLLVVSISSGLLYRMAGYELLPLKNIVFTGLEQVRFVGPTRIGDTLKMRGETIEMRPVNDQTGLITVRIQMVNQRGETVMSSRAKFAVPRRGPSADAVATGDSQS
ncbi:MAG: MaoC/PaaZ C-terminal domain-containing protein [Planctomycetaceae bacterium]|nr:MaoC/PaaZ C-terminal domain-containing protein [Planctomycetaceae bacterium]